jgi:hypothetical protein
MRRIRAATYVLAAILLTSCGSDSATSPSKDKDTLSGVFKLQWVNGKGLPISAEEAGVVVTLNTDLITFQLNGTFTQSTTMTVTQSGQTIGPASLLLDGTYAYALSTQAVSLRTSDGAQISGTVVNDTMTLQDGAQTFVYYRLQ